jgi:DNA-binding HxlR family transcriptional regulator
MPATTKPKKIPRSLCPVAGALDIVGDKWSLLVVRDILHGKRTYGELCASPEGIPTNILAERLKRLEEAGIITRAAYHQHPVRYAYQLTAKGRELGGVRSRLSGGASVTSRARARLTKSRVPQRFDLAFASPHVITSCVRSRASSM